MEKQAADDSFKDPLDSKSIDSEQSVGAVQPTQEQTFGGPYLAGAKQFLLRPE
jgi:hypothetical protein